MKTRHVIGLSMLAGVALGAIAVQGLNAQAMPPIYWVAEISQVTNEEGWRANTERPMATLQEMIKDFGGHYIARTENITSLDGTAPRRLIIAQFPSAEKAKAWYNSPKQMKVNETRMKNTKSSSFIVEGM